MSNIVLGAKNYGSSKTCACPAGMGLLFNLYKIL